ncbi:protein FAM83B-like [Mugil cephalus]|uniref:protein FAM83B-like n=1 Tax=Mugil cephalus TaxID=48193 RepID=UPI001FB5AFC9|nr:protein FAM83B-like [Mugil cephalus]
MESKLSCLSSLKEEDNAPYIQPHYRESYRLAIYALLCGGKEAYEEFLQAEKISHFLSEDEIFFILENAEQPLVDDSPEGRRVTDDLGPSTYFPTESDEVVPELDLGWTDVGLETTDTSISLLFHPPRQNTPTIKEVVRKQIQEAWQVIAIAMDVFTDIDIFKEIISATLRGVVVYILLDDSNFGSFLTMSHRVGVNIQDLKNLRVRTVQGQQYHCRSGMKFHGGLEQKFILLDGRTVLYGTYSYSWSFEKINVSMVLVVTGQLVCSYDEEFRRLYARSTVPAILSRGMQSLPYLADPVHLQSPNSSQLSLNQLHMRSRAMQGMRSAQDDRYNNGMMTRGLSMQERLHQSHYQEMGNLVRGHSYGDELQKLNSMTRQRMGPRDGAGLPVPQEMRGPNMRGGGDFVRNNRSSQQHHKHQTRYGNDQNLIPFSSETSLHRWKIDSYLNDRDMHPDASCDAISPHSSHTGLNEHQSNLIHYRSRDIKQRMEEMRQKRLSLQEYSNLRQSQESLRSLYQPLERAKFKSSLRGLDIRQSVAELETHTQDILNLENREPTKASDKREPVLTDAQRSASHYDIKTTSDRKTMQAYDWHEPISRTTSAADLDVKLNDASLKLAHLPSSSHNIQHPRAMESLMDIPEEKDSSNPQVNSLAAAALKDRTEEIYKDRKTVPKEDSRVPAEDQAGGTHASAYKKANSTGSTTPRGRKKSVSDRAETNPKVSNASTGSQHAVETPDTDGGQTEHEEAALQRRNSLTKKGHSPLLSDEKKAKKDKSLQRRPSLRSSNNSGSNQPLRTYHPQAAAAEQTTQKSQSQSISKSQNSLSGPSESQKSSFPRLSPQRSSKRKTNLPADQDRGSTNALDGEGATIYQATREKAYSRYEYLLSTEKIRMDKSMRTAGMFSPDKDRSSPLNRQGSGYPGYQAQSPDNKLGKFMQRMGNLITKNK